ncbi:MAG: hypothetical protein KAV87_21395 [Desulfobacteraceae bacterium]|nr:hypothetical protein [Desulfobacteraceae bacterium]
MIGGKNKGWSRHIVTVLTQRVKMNYLKNKDFGPNCDISSVFDCRNGFTRKDRELLIELRVKMGEIDKRFEQVVL